LSLTGRDNKKAGTRYEYPLGEPGENYISIVPLIAKYQLISQILNPFMVGHFF
jgi:hypothetical protein